MFFIVRHGMGSWCTYGDIYFHFFHMVLVWFGMVGIGLDFLVSYLSLFMWFCGWMDG